MLMSFQAKGPNANIVSHLIAKNPANLYERKEKGHHVRLVFTECTEETAEFFLYVDIDPVELVKNSPDLYNITHYINDREFAVSSLFCSFMKSALSTALNGKPKEEFAHWVNHRFPVTVRFGPVASDLSDSMLEKLFEPLGLQASIEYGQATAGRNKSSARFIELSGCETVQRLFRYLYILIPVLDNYKHYFIDEKDIDLLIRYGEGWLNEHPLKDFIVERSLKFADVIAKYQKAAGGEETAKWNRSTNERLKHEEENSVPLNSLRYEAIVNKVSQLENRRTIVDMGAGEGKLSLKLGFIPGVDEILAVEPSFAVQSKAAARFEKVKSNPNFLCPEIVWGSLFYYDGRFAGKDVMILCEVIEHIEQDRLDTVFHNILHLYKPRTLIVTTPNREYNDVYGLDDHYRHDDHRFEWTRQEFKNRIVHWCENTLYEYSIEGIGEEHEKLGQPTQMATFIRKEV